MENGEEQKNDGAGLIHQTIPDMAGTEPRLIIATVCGGKQALICRVTGKEHDMSAFVAEANGGSVACKDCGVTAMSLDLLLDLLELP